MKEEVKKELKNLMEKDTSKLLSYFTLIVGEECVKAKINELTLSLDADIEGNSYTIKQVITVEKI
jgi:hypothetical protein